MKRLIAIILTAFLLTACTASKPPEATSSASQYENTPNVTITSEDNWTELKFFSLGTLVQMKIFDMDEKEAAHVLKSAASYIDQYESKYSVQREDSVLSQLNGSASNTALDADEETIWLIHMAMEYAQLTDGYFDISVLPLVDLWGIGTSSPHVPTDQEREGALERIGYKNVDIDTEKKQITFLKEDMGLDLGGIAKGYIGDVVRDLMEDYGVKSAFINLGGNIVVVGNKSNGDPWRIGVQNPVELRGAYVGVLEILDESIVTSGGYERFFEKDGEAYHHILNPYTGFPAESDLSSVTIVSKSSTDADALSTSSFMLGLEKATELVNNLDEVEAVFITTDKKIYVTKGLDQRFQLSDDTFDWVNRPASEK